METVVGEGEQGKVPPGAGPTVPAAERLTASRVVLYAYLGEAGRQLSAIGRIRRFASEIRLLCGGTLLLALLRAAAPQVDARAIAILAVAALAVGLWIAARVMTRRLDAGFVSSQIAAARPALGDELRSFVELDEAARAGRLIEGDAFLVLLGERVRGLAIAAPIRDVLPRRPAWRDARRSIALSAAGLLFVHWVSPHLLPDLWVAVRKGERAAPPAPIPPIVGDLELVLTPPAYTGLPTRSLPASAGDVRALPGTQVQVRARSLVGAIRSAELRIEPDGKPAASSRAEVTRPSADGVPMLTGHFTVETPGSYAFVLWRWTGRMVEPTSHRIEVEADVVPRVELRVPADPLELDAPRPVELLYEVEDDFGVTDVVLVYQIDGREPVRKPLTPEQPTPRRARGRLLWEVGELEREGPLPSGAHVAYWIESHDNDAVSGPKLGRSAGRTLVLRGKHDPTQIDKATIETLVEAALAVLADRLDHTGQDAQRHAALQAFVVQLSGVERELAADGKKATPATTALKKLAGEIGKRLTMLGAEEERDPKGAADKIVAELERDVLLLDDLRGRRRLEQMARVGEEMQATRDQLKRLFDELKTATSEAHKAELRREIERKLTELEAKMAELKKLAADAEGEVPDEFLNREAIAKQDVKRNVDDIRKMLERGDLDKAQQELERMSKALDNLSKGMKADLQGFRGERDPEAEKALMQMESDLADLAKEQREVEKESRGIRERAAGSGPLASLKALRDKLKPKIEELERKAADQARDSNDFDSEGLERLKARAHAIGRALDAEDVGEARAMAHDAREAAASMERNLREVAQQLEEMAQARVGDGPPPAMKRARARMGEAEQLAGQIESELGKAEAERKGKMSDSDKQRLSELQQRQQTLQQRAEELTRRLGQGDQPGMGQVPGGVKGDVDGARSQMSEASRQLGRPAPARAADAAGQAAEKLEAARKRLADARQNGGDGGPSGDGSQGQRDEPVKIPGADDSAAPRAFREELLDAMKRGAPRKFEDQVRQYYEELVR